MAHEHLDTDDALHIELPDVDDAVRDLIGPEDLEPLSARQYRQAVRTVLPGPGGRVTEFVTDHAKEASATGALGVSLISFAGNAAAQSTPRQASAPHTAVVPPHLVTKGSAVPNNSGPRLIGTVDVEKGNNVWTLVQRVVGDSPSLPRDVAATVAQDHLNNRATIYPNERLKLFQAVAVPPPPPPPTASRSAAQPTTMEFERGQTVWGQGIQDGFTITQFAEDNQGVNPNLVYTGVAYNRPGPADIASEAAVHSPESSSSHDGYSGEASATAPAGQESQAPSASAVSVSAPSANAATAAPSETILPRQMTTDAPGEEATTPPAPAPSPSVPARELNPQLLKLLYESGDKNPAAAIVAPTGSTTNQAPAGQTTTENTPPTTAPAASTTASQPNTPNTTKTPDTGSGWEHRYVDPGSPAATSSSAQPPAAAPKAAVVPEHTASAARPEAPASVQAHAELTLNAQQEGFINALNLSPAKAGFLSEMVVAVHEAKLTGAPVNEDDDLAQSIIESGWGQSELAAVYHNPFGMKAGSDWTGPTVQLPTQEYGPDGYYTTMATWKVFPNFTAAAINYAQMVQSSGIYPEAVACDNNDATYVEGLEQELNASCVQIYSTPQHDAYATDPNYPSTILNFVSSENINLIVSAWATPPAAVTPPQTQAATVQPAQQTAQAASSPGSKIASEALALGWPTRGHGPALADATPAYQQARIQTGADNSVAGASDCGEFDAVVIEETVDANYPARGTYHQLAYLQSHPQQWESLGTYVPLTQLQPGDIFINDYHTYIYVGEQPNGFNTVAASLYGHVPEPDNVFYAENGQPFQIFRAIS